MVNLGIPGLSAAEMVGSGGSAAVFAATDETGASVAVKLLRLSASNPRTKKQFERECAALERLSEHRSIVPILGSGTNDRGEPYLLMPLMSSSVQEVLDERGAMNWERALDVLLVVSGAIDFAHSRDVLHRDIKPGNILLDAEGKPLVADFGIAKMLDQTQAVSSVLELTTAFAPPERFRGAPASVRTDLYSLAATYVSLVTGTPPFPSNEPDTPEALIRRVLDEAPVDLRDPVPDIPSGVAATISAALAKDPEQRPSSVEEFRSALLSQGDPKERSSWETVTVALPSSPVTMTAAQPQPVAAQPRAFVDQPAPVTAAPTSPDAAFRPLVAAAALVSVLAIAFVGWLFLGDGSNEDQVQTASASESADEPLPEAEPVAEAEAEVDTTVPPTVVTATTAAPTIVTATTAAPTTTTTVGPSPDQQFIDFAEQVELGFSSTWATDLLGAPDVFEELAVSNDEVSTFVGEQTGAVIVANQGEIIAWGVVSCAAQPNATSLGFELGTTPLAATPAPRAVRYNLTSQLVPQDDREFSNFFAHFWGGQTSAEGPSVQFAAANYRCDEGPYHCAIDALASNFAGNPNYFGPIGGEPFPVDLDSCMINMVGQVTTLVGNVELPTNSFVLTGRLDFLPEQLVSG